MPIIRKEGDYRLEKKRLEIDTDTSNILALDSELDDLISTVSLLEPFESGVEAVFYQSTSPTGWTTRTTNLSGSTLRIVNGESSPGGSTGGTHSLESPPSTLHDHGNLNGTSLATSQGPYHYHGMRGDDDVYGNDTTPPVRGNAIDSYNMYTNYQGGSSHNHSLAADSSVTAFSPKYIEIIVAIKN